MRRYFSAQLMVEGIMSLQCEAIDMTAALVSRHFTKCGKLYYNIAHCAIWSHQDRVAENFIVNPLSGVDHLSHN